jgi:hypothetical protein
VSVTAGEVQHVVALVEEQLLIDAAIDQANRPRWGIKFPDVVGAECDRNFLKGASMMVGAENGSWATYTYVPSARTYTHSPDWRLPERTADLVEEIVQLVRERI